jgi:hypothetical protein
MLAHPVLAIVEPVRELNELLKVLREPFAFFVHVEFAAPPAPPLAPPD